MPQKSKAEIVFERIDEFINEISHQNGFPVDDIYHEIHRRKWSLLHSPPLIHARAIQRRKRAQKREHLKIKILKLRQANKSLRDIAQELNVGLSLTASLSAELAREGKIARNYSYRSPSELANTRVSKKVNEDIIELHQQGLLQREIGEKLKIPTSVLHYRWNKLLKERRIEPRYTTPGRQALSDEEYEKYKAQIMALWNEGKRANTITESLNLPHRKVRLIILRLKKEELLQNAPNSWPYAKKAIDLNVERNKIIIEMTQEGRTLDEIGKNLGITRERVRQIKQRIALDWGEEIMAPTIPRPPTLAEIAQKIGASKELVQRWAQKNPSLKKWRKRWVFTDEDLARMKREIIHERKCRVCGDVFLTAGRRMVCKSHINTPEYHKWRNGERKKVVPDIERMPPWRREVIERLASHTVPENEEWIGQKDAENRTGATGIQLMWLRNQNILHSKPHETLRWPPDKTKPVMLYAASEVEIVRQVYEKHGRPRGAPHPSRRKKKVEAKVVNNSTDITELKV